MEQLTLEQAANKYAPDHGVGLQSDFAKDKQRAFKAGAEWKKEQYKPLKTASERALDYLSVKYPKEAEILHELKSAIELLQD